MSDPQHPNPSRDLELFALPAETAMEEALEIYTQLYMARIYRRCQTCGDL